MEIKKEVLQEHVFKTEKQTNQTTGALYSISLDASEGHTIAWSDILSRNT